MVGREHLLGRADVDQMDKRVVGRRVATATELLALLLLFVVTAPVVSGVIQLIDANVGEVLDVYRNVLLNTFTWSALSAAICVLFALVLNLILFAALSQHSRKTVTFAFLLPVFSSTAARVFAWVLLFSTFAPLGRIFSTIGLVAESSSPLNSPSVLILFFVALYLPIAVYTIYAFASTVPEVQREAASVLGAGRHGSALYVRRRAMFAGCGVAFCLVFISSHAALMAPSVFGGSGAWFVSTSVERLINVTLDQRSAQTLSNIDMVLSVAAVMLTGLAVSRWTRPVS